METGEPKGPGAEFWANDTDGFYERVFEPKILDNCRNRNEENIFIVPEISEYVDRVKGAGGRFIGRDFVTINDQIIAVCMDCYGNLIMLVQYHNPHD